MPMEKLKHHAIKLEHHMYELITNHGDKKNMLTEVSSQQVTDLNCIIINALQLYKSSLVPGWQRRNLYQRHRQRASKAFNQTLVNISYHTSVLACKIQVKDGIAEPDRQVPIPRLAKLLQQQEN